MLRPVGVFAVMMLLAVGVSILATWQMLVMRHDNIAYARITAKNILLLVERDFHRDLDVHAQTLQTISNVIRSSDPKEVAGATLEALVQGHAAGAKEIGTIVVTDARGLLLQDLHNPGETLRDLSRREYFTSHLENPHDLHLSHPFRPDYPDSQPSVALSRSILDDKGRLLGVAAVIKSLQHVATFIQGLDLDEDGIVAIRLLDGTPLAQWPPEARSWDGEKASFNGFVGSKKAEEITDTLDRSEPHWRGYRRVGQYPVVVSVDMAHKSILKTWIANTTITGALLLIFNLVTVMFAFRLSRYLQSKEKTVTRLRDQASTDPLTGLHNRRWFDEKSRQEWHRHLRGGDLAVLMLDIDQFKAYNDHYGHPAGDQALANVAVQVRLGCRREEDGAARYGGEEFVVLLPNCDLEGARSVAENIRSSVERTAIPHEKSTRGVVTISIGVACTSASKVESVEALIGIADERLYEAKNAGRNRVAG